LREEEWADREIRVGLDYEYPEPTTDPRGLSDFFEVIESGEIVREIASKLSFGGTYAEEVLKRANLDKTTDVEDLDSQKKELIQEEIIGMLEYAENPDPILYMDEEEPVRSSPFPLEKYADNETIEFDLFSEAIDEYYYRKKALEEASGDWICMIDADEMIPSNLAEALQSKVNEDKYDVIYSPMKNYIMGEWIDCAAWWPAYKPVLYRTDVAKLSDKIHNFISFPESAKEFHFEPVESNAIVHFNYTDISDFLSRMDRYTTIEAEQTDFSYISLFLRPIFEFFYRFLLKKGYKKGSRGFFLSVFMAWYRFLTMAKCWEYLHWGRENEIIEKYGTIREEVRSGYNNQPDENNV
jgi:hypothetical protein